MRIEGHTHFFTVGGLIGTPACNVPTCGRAWQPMLQPIVLSEWPVTPGLPGAAWTTVGNWRGYGSITHDGVLFGQKAHSFRRLLDLPARSGAHIRPALMIHRGEKNDLAALRQHRWDLVDPADVASTPDAYREFVRGSKGELGIAKSGYVESHCMVQRSQRLLPRVGPPRDRARHRLWRVSADGGGPVRVQYD